MCCVKDNPMNETQREPSGRFVPWTPAEDAALREFTLAFTCRLDRPASVVARMLAKKFPNRTFTKSNVIARLRRIFRSRGD